MSIFEKIDQFHKTHGYTFQEIEGLRLPLHYTTGLEKEIAFIQNTTGVIDLTPFHLIAIEGREAAIFLQGMVSNDVHQIQRGQIQPNLLSNHKGKILYKLDIARLTEKVFFLLTNAGEGPYVGRYLEHFHIQEDLEMRLLPPDFLRCDVLGPTSTQVLSTLGYSGELHWNFQNDEMTSFSTNIGKIPGFVNIVPQACYPRFLEALLQISAEVGLVGFEALDQVRIDEGIPRIGVDYTQNNFPQEAALRDHISYEKGCYIGQETHARMYHRGHPNWQSVGIAVPFHLQLKPGQKLFHDEEEIGTITSLSHIVNNDTQHGIAFIKYKRVQDNILLAIEAGQEKIIPQFPLTTNTVS